MLKLELEFSTQWDLVQDTILNVLFNQSSVHAQGQGSLELIRTLANKKTFTESIKFME